MNELSTIETKQTNYAAMSITLQKHAHAIYRDFLALKIEIFQLKYFDIFLISAQNIDCGYTLEQPRRVPTIYVLEQK